jgi:GTPase SAR1 family protein
LGAPGTGKTTFCFALQQFLEQLKRTHALINLDPANENMEYKVDYFKSNFQCDIDIQGLITLNEIMDKLQLGPNGAMIYAMEFLEENINYLEEKILERKDCKYFIFDLPGQVELYSNHESLKKVL